MSLWKNLIVKSVMMALCLQHIHSVVHLCICYIFVLEKKGKASIFRDVKAVDHLHLKVSAFERPYANAKEQGS